MTIFYLNMIYLTIYSFAGWLMETLVCSFEERKYVNRGFLTGPFCPIYGFGAIMIIAVLRPLGDAILLVFVAGIVMTSLLEYFTGFLLERIFSMKWWDYSTRFMNIHGRVCLTNALAFGAMAVALIVFIHPKTELLVGWIPGLALPWLAWMLMAYFIIDTIVAAKAALALKGRLAKIHEALNELEEKSHAYADAMAAAIDYRKVLATEKLEEKGHAYREALTESFEQAKAQAAEKLEAAKAQYEALMDRPRRLHRRFLIAFPRLSSVKHQNSLQRLRDSIVEQWQARKENLKR